ncbi:SlyX family protein [Aurantimonas sp. Leaf443]|uniref:SlyX family protein n=1 Tax=Aurantimonas sp. Leaf443 TaxID=1736378 RepID=UPI0006F8BF61|nr:SlyX family protein [Aurantimonas sp. Leaf443]KQT83042.1 hypothetical protein ASG48_13735 [Aurantimonas sp. Leaf443]
MSSDVDRQRIEDLEIMVAHQAKTIEELSDELKGAHDQLVALQRAVKQIADRVNGLEEGGFARPEITKPPHY